MVMQPALIRILCLIAAHAVAKGPRSPRSRGMIWPDSPERYQNFFYPVTGAGAEMRKALSTLVFSDTLGMTFFRLFLTPIFYIVIRQVTERKNGRKISYNSNGDK